MTACPVCLRFVPFRFAAAAALAASALAFAAQAGAADSVVTAAATAAETAADALAKADARLAQYPQDVQARFARAQALADAGRHDAARTVLEGMTRDHPELPEPWNNLAVLHARRGDLGQAAAALEQALHIHPAHATVLENLGDVRARQALLAWRQAAAAGAADSAATARLRERMRALGALPGIGDGGAGGKAAP